MSRTSYSQRYRKDAEAAECRLLEAISRAEALALRGALTRAAVRRLRDECDEWLGESEISTHKGA